LLGVQHKKIIFACHASLLEGHDRINNGRIKIVKNAGFYAYLFPDNHETVKLFHQLKNGLIYNVDFRKEYQDA